MNRRSLLKFMGVSPITAPLAAKHLQDTATAVFSLDRDLASYRSFSLAAKITYQRRRNVERRLVELQGDVPVWNKVSSLIESALGKLLK